MPVLVLRSVDDSANLRVMRAVLEALRARDYGRLRVGPFDDGLAAEIGVFVEGPKGALERLRPDLDRRLARAVVPALIEQLEIMETRAEGAGL